MKNIAVVFTGGTISMKVDERISAAIPMMSSEEIMSMIHNIDKVANIREVKFGSYPGPHMNIDRLIELRKVVNDLVNDAKIDGVVITHGTDSLEETAFFLDLSIDTVKPIVVVGAMRNGSELGYDGPSNLSSAICTAQSDSAKNMGVLIVMNNEVNPASEVTKTHTMALDTFKSMEFGPLGIVDNDEVIFYRKPIKHSLIGMVMPSEKVYLIKACTGSNSDLINYLVDMGAEGIVIEAMGRGNVPPEMLSGIKNAIDKNVVIVIVSRCPLGRVADSYGYVGGGKTISNMGAIFASNLNGQKARIKLMLALGSSSDINKIKEYFSIEMSC
ncbi:MAG: L-asparaginase [Clostridiales bacterium]|nr:MAG: L-asparaginase [Clostridiales bacterium]